MSKKGKIVFTNGCFDLLHPGHFSLLEFCAGLGEVVVGLNSDDSVRRLKGFQRPIIPQEFRKYSLEACKWVSEVHVFDEDTPLELIRKLQPDIVVKGGEYRGRTIVGHSLAEIVLFEPVNNFSTTGLVERIRSNENI